jgi:hypothetical protein
MQTEILGIDLGNTVIKDRRPLPDAFRVIRRLMDERFGSNVHIVSRVNAEQKKRARAFVTSPDFVRNVGIPLDRVHFCPERRDKAEICSRLLITHMIDDRPEVHLFMPQCVKEKILFDPTYADLEAWRPHIYSMIILRSWLAVEKHFFPAQ